MTSRTPDTVKVTVEMPFPSSHEPPAVGDAAQSQNSATATDPPSDPRLQKRYFQDGNTIKIKVPNTNYKPQSADESTHQMMAMMANYAGYFNVLESWRMEDVEQYFKSRGYEEEVEFVRQVELGTQILYQPGVFPIHLFALKMGVKLMDLFRTVRTLEREAADAKNAPKSSGWDAPSAGSSFNRSFDSGNRGGRRGGGRGGGGGVCFKCNEPGHFARECPTGGGGGGGGRGGFRGRGSGGGSISGGWNNDGDNRPAKRPRSSDVNDDWGTGPSGGATATATSASDAWEDNGGGASIKRLFAVKTEDEDDWDTPQPPRAENPQTVPQSAAATAPPAAKPPASQDDEESWD